MKIYLAAQFARREELRQYAAALRSAGHVCTSTWLNQDTPLDGKMTNHTEDANREFAMRDLADIDRADALVFFSEDPTVGVPRGARHVEFGYAIKGKDLAVVGPRENVFHWLLPDRAFHATFDDFLTALTDQHGLPEWCFGTVYGHSGQHFPFRRGARIQHVSGDGDVFIVRTVDDSAYEAYAEREAPAIGPGTRVINPSNWKAV